MKILQITLGRSTAGFPLVSPSRAPGCQWEKWGMYKRTDTQAGTCCPAACHHQHFPTAQPFCTSPADTIAFTISVFLPQPTSPKVISFCNHHRVPLAFLYNSGSDSTGCRSTVTLLLPGEEQELTWHPGDRFPVGKWLPPCTSGVICSVREISTSSSDIRGQAEESAKKTRGGQQDCMAG